MKTKEENYKKEEWGGWKIVSDMLDRPNEYGIYPTGECYQKLYDFVVSQKQKAIAQTREETIRGAIKQIEEVKDVIRKQTGAFKYDDCYDDCIKILNKLKQ